MGLKQQIPAILKHIELNSSKISDNQTIFNILEGDILSQIHAKIEEQLSGESVKISKQRAVPINILRKMIDKLSTLYNIAPDRIAKLENDQELMDDYTSVLNINDQLGTVNESFNAYKYGVEEIFYNENDKAINIRTLPTYLFLPYGDDRQNPLRTTVMIKFMGSKSFKKGTGIEADGSERSNQVKSMNVFHLFSDTEFLSITGNGDIVQSDMIENPEGVNPYGVIPFSYVSRSKYLLIPKTDSDTITMSASQHTVMVI